MQIISCSDHNRTGDRASQPYIPKHVTFSVGQVFISRSEDLNSFKYKLVFLFLGMNIRYSQKCLWAGP